MNSELEYHHWLIFFSNLGSRSVPRTNKKIWMDLEHFIVLGAKYATRDSRTFTSFILICINLSPVLSPFKIKKIALKELTKEQFNTLGYIVSKIQENVRNPTQWNALILICNKKKTKQEEILLFGSRTFKTAPELKKWHLNTAGLELDNPEKYLNTRKLYSHSLVNQRFSGIKVVYSDINFYRQFFKVLWPPID